MVFSSVPLYLDPPNWQQQPSDQHQVGGNRQNETTHHHILHQQHPQHLPILPPLPQQQHQTNGVLPSSQIPTSAATTSSPTSTTSNRPTSMSERARLAKMIPQHAPDGGPLKCPRCESTNTKFCYFNNYSLSQPRHFCKTCRRYWTLGGALRNVPVGGGCRRNNSKRCSKGASGSRLKSPAVSNTSVPHEEEQQQQQSVGQHGGGNISSTALLSQFAGLNNNCSNVNPPSQFSFMGSLQNLTAQLGIGSSGNNLGLGMRFGSNGRIDQMGQLDFGGILQQQQQQHAQHQQQQQQQQQQQLPLLSGFGLYPFQNETTTTTTSMYGGGRGSTVPEMFITRPSKTSESVKMEEMQGGIQLGHHSSLSKEQQLSSGGEQSTDHHHPQDHNRSSGTPHLWVGNNNSANNNNNNNSNGLVSATSANNLWTDLSGLN